MDTLFKYLDMLAVKLTLFVGLVLVTVEKSPQAFLVGALTGIILLTIVEVIDVQVRKRKLKRLQHMYRDRRKSDRRGQR